MKSLKSEIWSGLSGPLPSQKRGLGSEQGARHARKAVADVAWNRGRATRSMLKRQADLLRARLAKFSVVLLDDCVAFACELLKLLAIQNLY